MNLVALFYQELTREGRFYPPPPLYRPTKSPTRLGLKASGKFLKDTCKGIL